jgi:hypothetical protein
MVEIKLKGQVYFAKDEIQAIIYSWTSYLGYPIDEAKVAKIYVTHEMYDWADLIGIIEYTLTYWEEVKDLTPEDLGEQYTEAWQ